MPPLELEESAACQRRGIGITRAPFDPRDLSEPLSGLDHLEEELVAGSSRDRELDPPLQDPVHVRSGLALGEDLLPGCDLERTTLVREVLDLVVRE